MNFLELVTQRQSVRKFDASKTISQEIVNSIIEAGRLAPSACNSQPWTFIWIDDTDLKKKIAMATVSNLINLNKFTVDAAGILVLVMEKPKLVTQIGGSLKKKEYPLIDIGIASIQMCLQAEYEGVGSCMIGWFDENKIKSLLEIPKRKTVGLVIAFGYAIENYRIRAKMRKPIDEVFKKNRY